MEKIPCGDCPLTIGVAATDQLLPASVVRNTRAADPPVANQAFFFPCTAIHVPLAANAPSPSIAGGSFAADTSSQCAPPSAVAMITKRPSIGSLTASPCCASQNAMQSKNAFALSLVNCRFQCWPASVVLKMRD